MNIDNLSVQSDQPVSANRPLLSAPRQREILLSKTAMLGVVLGLCSISGSLRADAPQVKAHSDYREAIAAVTSSERDDPEIKAAVDAVRAIDAINHGKLDEGVDPLEIEEAQLNLELILLKKAKIRRPGATDMLKQRRQEVESRLSGIDEERKKKPTKERADANHAP